VQNTDFGRGRIDASRIALGRDLVPFRQAVRAHVPAVMVGTAIYPSYGSDLPSACVPAIVDGLLRRQLGFTGVALSDDLGTAGVSRTIPPLEATVRAVQAGIDLVYIASQDGHDEAISNAAFDTLLRAAARGEISETQLRSSYERTAALKRRFAPPANPAGG
jgi:beta-N-acetylhexosaminidase